MKTYLIFFFIINLAISSPAQIFQAAKLSSVINNCSKDSVQKTERLAALKFHQLINEYRLINKLDTLAWDDVLWLTSRNHNIWMGENDVLSHHQEKGTQFFTGADPGDRYEYAASGKTGTSWSGENALYNWNDNGSSISEISDAMAMAAFNQWKNSPGHDENMRAPQSHSHGTAFYLEPGGPVWATDLFSYGKPDNIFALAKSEPAAVENSSLKVEVKSNDIKKGTVRKIRLKDAMQLNAQLLSMLESSSKVKTSKAMKKAAQKHADYMAYSKNLTHREKKDKPGYFGLTEKQRMLKASFGVYFFSQHKIKLSESIAQLELTTIPDDLTNLSVKLITALDSEKHLQGKTVSIGYGIAFKQLKSSLSIYVVRLERIKPGDHTYSYLSNK